MRIVNNHVLVIWTYANIKKKKDPIYLISDTLENLEYKYEGYLYENISQIAESNYLNDYVEQMCTSRFLYLENAYEIEYKQNILLG